MDLLWIKLRNYQCDKRTLYLGAFYFQPNTNTSVYEKIGEMIIQLAMQEKDILLVGDFNIRAFTPEISKNEMMNNSKLRELFCFTRAAGLQSHNNVLNHQGKTLDLVLSNLRTVTVTEASPLAEPPDKYHPPLDIVLQISSRSTKHTIMSHTIDSNTNTLPRLNFPKGDYLKLYNTIK